MVEYKLTPLETGFFKLDGGAMFGVVPKTMWQKLNPPDENNLCTWAMRCLLIESDDRKILVDTGLGDKQDEKFTSHFHPHGKDSLVKSLKKAGLKPSDITDVFLTHLHFDHVGGAVIRNKKGELVPAFENATYWCNKTHYDWAYSPNARERASFLKENFVPLQEHGVLRMIPVQQNIEWMPGINIHFCYGHTEAMMLLKIKHKGTTVTYCADLLASSFHTGIPYVMSYDLRPLVTIKEKEDFFNQALNEKWVLFLEHDPLHECITLTKNERGRIVNDKRGTLKELTQ